MSNAGEILREAQFELQNVGSASTTSKKSARKARSLAHKVIRRFPDSPEADSARAVLEQLGQDSSVFESAPFPAKFLFGNFLDKAGKLKQQVEELNREAERQAGGDDERKMEIMREMMKEHDAMKKQIQGAATGLMRSLFFLFVIVAVAIFAGAGSGGFVLMPLLAFGAIFAVFRFLSSRSR